MFPSTKCGSDSFMNFPKTTKKESQWDDGL